MKLYKTTYNTTVVAPDGHFVQASQWHGAAADASKARTAMKGENRASDPHTTILDVSTDKQSLMHFLNTLTDRKN